MPLFLHTPLRYFYVLFLWFVFPARPIIRFHRPVPASQTHKEVFLVRNSCILGRGIMTYGREVRSFLCLDINSWILHVIGRKRLTFVRQICSVSWYNLNIYINRTNQKGQSLVIRSKLVAFNCEFCFKF
jgi:hypothetical protein